MKLSKTVTQMKSLSTGLKNSIWVTRVTLWVTLKPLYMSFG